MTTARARERLRQERETFEQARRHDARWFGLRLIMGYATIALLLGIALVAACIVLQPARYAGATIAIAGTALLVDMVSLVATIFKLVLPQNRNFSLRPITELHSNK